MIPDWMPKEAWEAYLLMRKGMGKKYVATEYAQTLLIKKLDKWRSEGQDIEEIINKSIEFSYTGLFPLKDQKAANWWATTEGIIAKGREFGLEAGRGEGMPAFKDRINKIIAAGGIERRAEARSYQASLLDAAPDRTDRATSKEIAKLELQAALKASRERTHH